jgi:hypothetical protein
VALPFDERGGTMTTVTKLGFDERRAVTHPACPQMSYREAHA